MDMVPRCIWADRYVGQVLRSLTSFSNSSFSRSSDAPPVSPLPKIHHVISSSPITDMFTSPPATPAVNKPLPIQTSPRVPASSTQDNVTDVSALSAVVAVSLPTSYYTGFRPSMQRRRRMSSRMSCQGILTGTRSSLTSPLRHSTS